MKMLLSMKVMTKTTAPIDMANLGLLFYKKISSYLIWLLANIKTQPLVPPTDPF